MKKILALTIPFLFIGQALALNITVNNDTSTGFTATTVAGKVLGTIKPKQQGYPLNIPNETPIVKFNGSDGNNSAVYYRGYKLQCTSQTWYPCTVTNNNTVTINPH